LGLYNEVYRRTGVEHQIALALPAAATLAIIGIDRGREASDFSERERRLLDLLRPHLIQAYRNAEVFSESQGDLTLLGRAVGSLGRGVIVSRRDGRTVSINERAERLIARYFGESARRRQPIPDPLRTWLQYEEALLAAHDDVPRPRAPFVLDREPGRLIVRFLSEPGLWVLILEEQAGAIGAESLRRLGLTRREAEVLAWVAHGKTNAEVAAILGTSPKTINKHLQRIYPILGVETRTAAAVRAFEVADEPQDATRPVPPAR
jgi:DNA-binding CsgD family transcriptional regulator